MNADLPLRNQPFRTGTPSCLNMLRLPARLNVEQTAEYIGCQSHDIPVLVRAGLLKPLGGGPRNCVKYFATAEIEELARDKRWLDRATKALNRRKRPTPDSGGKYETKPQNS
jgi:hypothetical protein